MKALESNLTPDPKAGHLVLGVFRWACVLALCASAAFATEPAYIRSQGRQFTIGNRYLDRTITIEGGHPYTSQFENKISKRTYQVSGNEFRLELIWERLNYTAGVENPWKLDASSFKLDGNRMEELPGGAKRLIFNLTNQEREPTLHVELIYEVHPSESVIRQWLQLKTEGQGKLFVHYADVETNEWHGSHMRLGGFGQPIYSDDLFWGLEYPSGVNRFNGSQVSLGSYVGLNIPADGMTTEKAVVGVAEPGKVQTAFFSYINAIRAQPVRPYVLYNTWYDLQRMAMADGNTRQRVHELNEILQSKYKLKLDSFVLDDGWDNMKTLWRIDTGRFTNGFTDLSAALKQIGSGLGIWYGPVGGYDDRELRIATGRAQGMEVQSNSDYLCLAGRHYSEYFENSVLEMQKKYDINFFKLDGVPFGCNEPDHGHPIGIYSREADERVFVDLLTKLRKQKPDVFLNVTTGIWLSPWWLQYADVVWMGGEDSGYLSSLPTLSPRQSALSYRDSVLYDDFVRNQLQFPVSSIMTHGIIRGKYNLLGGAQESLADWRDELVHYVSVGNMMTELYITPELLNHEEWDDLAATLHWAQANRHPLLDDTKMVLGDPARREPYGFVHASAGRAILTLRNPFAQPQLVHLRLDEASGFLRDDKRYRLQTLYPFQLTDTGSYSYGDTVDLRLDAFEQRVLQLNLADESDPGLLVTGARYTIEDKGNGTAVVHVFAAPGVKRSIGIEGNQDAAHRFDIQFGKPGQKESAISTSAAIVDHPSPNRTTVDLRFQVPPDIPNTTVALLFEPKGATAEIRASVIDNGSPVALTNENGQGVWQWFSFVLAPGNHNVHVSLELPASLKQGGKLSAWATSERRLAEQTISVKLTAAQAIASLPTANNIEKTTTALLEQTIP